MSKTNSRFSVSSRSVIEEEYVLYVEELHVSFFSNSRKYKLKEKIQHNKRLIKSLNKKNFKEKIIDLKKENEILLSKLNYEKENKRIDELNKLIKKTKNKDDLILFKNEIKELKKSIKESKEKINHVLKGVTLGLRRGETLAIVGANGAGKTVLIETILGINIPDYYEKLILNLGKKKFVDNLKEVGIQYQQSKIQSSVKVKDLINSYRKLYGKKVVSSELQKMVDLFGIYDFINSKVESLSGGQKQRLNLLLAIMHQPKLMILDEFITGLDVKTVRNIISYVNELKVKNNSSMIIISHQPEEIEELADRIVVMKNGVVVEETNVPKIIKEYGSMAHFLEEKI
ncbi:MAG: hypothetical protein TYPL_0790 [Candidatus Tyloplasma litorale]|nr:MAG: hypothetical protein TYPL_0790 [Mycoplasmatales bacterium]